MSGHHPWPPPNRRALARPVDPLTVAQSAAATISFDHTLPTSRSRLPSEHVFTSLAILAAIVCIGAGDVIGRYQGAVTVTRTVHVRESIAQQYGKPDTIVDGAQVNAQLAGWKCALYVSRKVVLCHQ